jgi:hypothetical protein
MGKASGIRLEDTRGRAPEGRLKIARRFNAGYGSFCLLLPDGAVPVKPAALKEAVTHHALAKQKKDDYQEDYKQEVSNSKRGRLWLFRVCRIY